MLMVQWSFTKLSNTACGSSFMAVLLKIVYMVSRQGTEVDSATETCASSVLGPLVGW